MSEAPATPALEPTRVIRLASVDSTQRYVAALLDSEVADGTVVVADTQTAGRGRRGRVWRDVPGASVLMSIVLRTSLPPARVPTLSIAAGVAVAEALTDSAGRRRLKKKILETIHQKTDVHAEQVLFTDVAVQ